MAITMTATAAEHVTKHLAQRGEGIGVRVGVRTSGCSGLAYVLEFVDKADEGDQIFEDHGVKIVVDEKIVGEPGYGQFVPTEPAHP